MVRGVPSFCPYCGAELAERRFEGRDRRYCDDCEAYVWRDPGPCAGVAVVDEGRVLLVKRAIEPWKGLWDFPAGFLDVDEHPRDGAVRELREETGLEADPDDLSLVRTAVYGRGQGDEHVLLVLYVVPRSATAGDVVVTEETSAARFFSPEAFDRSDESMIPPVRELFERVANWNRGSNDRSGPDDR